LQVNLVAYEYPKKPENVNISGEWDLNLEDHKPHKENKAIPPHKGTDLTYDLTLINNTDVSTSGDIKLRYKGSGGTWWNKPGHERDYKANLINNGTITMGGGGPSVIKDWNNNTGNGTLNILKLVSTNQDFENGNASHSGATLNVGNNTTSGKFTVNAKFKNGGNTNINKGAFTANELENQKNLNVHSGGELNVNNQFENSGNIKSSGKIISNANIQNRSNGKIELNDDGILTANQNLNNQGILDLNGKASAKVTHGITNSNKINLNSATSKVETGKLDNSGEINSKGDITVTNNLNNFSTGKIKNEGNLKVIQKLTNDNKIESSGNIEIGGELVNNSNGKINNTGNITTHGNLTNDGSIKNTGNITVDKDNAVVKNYKNEHGGTIRVVGKDTEITGDFNNNNNNNTDPNKRSTLEVGDGNKETSLALKDNSTTFNNQSDININKNATLTANKDMNNGNTSNISINGGNLEIADDKKLTNNNVLTINENGNLKTGSLDNTGTLTVTKGTATIKDTLNNNNKLNINKDSSVTADKVNNLKNITSSGTITANNGFTNDTNGNVKLENGGVIKTENSKLDNKGIMTLRGVSGDANKSKLITNDFDNSGTLKLTNNTYSKVKNNFNNTGTISLNSNDDNTNPVAEFEGSFKNNGTITLQKGVIRSKEDILNEAAGNLNVSNGIFETEKSINNQGTVTLSGGNMTVKEDLNNDNNFTSNSGSTLTVKNDIKNTGNANLTLQGTVNTGKNLINEANGKTYIKNGGNVSVENQLTNDGELYINRNNNDTKLTTKNLVNNNKIESDGDITSEELSNSTNGKIENAGNITVKKNLVNSGTIKNNKIINLKGNFNNSNKFDNSNGILNLFGGNDKTNETTIEGWGTGTDENNKGIEGKFNVLSGFVSYNKNNTDSNFYFKGNSKTTIGCANDSSDSCHGTFTINNGSGHTKLDGEVTITKKGTFTINGQANIGNNKINNTGRLNILGDLTGNVDNINNEGILHITKKTNNATITAGSLFNKVQNSNKGTVIFGGNIKGDSTPPPTNLSLTMNNNIYNGEFAPTSNINDHNYNNDKSLLNNINATFMNTNDETYRPIYLMLWLLYANNAINSKSKEMIFEQGMSINGHGNTVYNSGLLVFKGGNKINNAKINNVGGAVVLRSNGTRSTDKTSFENLIKSINNNNNNNNRGVFAFENTGGSSTEVYIKQLSEDSEHYHNLSSRLILRSGSFLFRGGDSSNEQFEHAKLRLDTTYISPLAEMRMAYAYLIQKDNTLFYNRGNLAVESLQNVGGNVDLDFTKADLVNDGNISIGNDVSAELKMKNDKSFIIGTTLASMRMKNTKIIEDVNKGDNCDSSDPLCIQKIEALKDQYRKKYGIEPGSARDNSNYFVHKTLDGKMYTTFTPKLNIFHGSSEETAGKLRVSANGIINRGIVNIGLGTALAKTGGSLIINNGDRKDDKNVLHNYGRVNIATKEKELKFTLNNYNEVIISDSKSDILSNYIKNRPIFNDVYVKIVKGCTPDATDPNDECVKKKVLQQTIAENKMTLDSIIQPCDRQGGCEGKSIDELKTYNTIFEIGDGATFNTTTDMISNHIYLNNKKQFEVHSKNRFGNGIIHVKKGGTFNISSEANGKTYISGLASDEAHANRGIINITKGNVHVSPTIKENGEITRLHLHRNFHNLGKLNISAGATMHVYGDFINMMQGSIKGEVDNKGTLHVHGGISGKDGEIVKIKGYGTSNSNKLKGTTVIDDGWVTSEDGKLFHNEGTIKITETGILKITDIDNGTDYGKIVNNGKIAVTGKILNPGDNKREIKWADTEDTANTGRINLMDDEKRNESHNGKMSHITLSKNKFYNGNNTNNDKAVLDIEEKVSVESKTIENYGRINVANGAKTNIEKLNMYGSSILSINSNLRIGGTISSTDDVFIKEINFNNGGHVMFGEKGNENSTFTMSGLYNTYANANIGKFEIVNGTVTSSNDIYNKGNLTLNDNSNLTLGNKDYSQENGSITLNVNGFKRGNKEFISARNITINGSTFNVNVKKLVHLFSNQNGRFKIAHATDTLNSDLDLSTPNLNLNGKDSSIEMKLVKEGNDLYAQFVIPEKLIKKFSAGKRRNEVELGKFLLKVLKNGQISENILGDAVESFLLNGTTESEINKILNQLTLRTAETPIYMLSKNVNQFNSKIIENIAKDSLAPIHFGTLNFLNAENKTTKHTTLNAELSYMANQYNSIIDTDNMSTIEEKIYKKLRKTNNNHTNGRSVKGKDKSINNYTSMWVDMINSKFERKITTNFSEYSSTTNGFIVGFEENVISDNDTKSKTGKIYKYGIAFGVSQSKSTDKKDVQKDMFYDISSNNINMAIYGSIINKKSSITGIGSYNSSSFNQDRNIVISVGTPPHTHTATANAKYKSNVFALYGEYKYNLYSNLQVRGFTNYSMTKQEGFTETAAGIPALGVKAKTYSDANVGYGFEYAKFFLTRNESVIIIPHLGLSHSISLITKPVDLDTYFLSIGPDYTFKTLSEDRSKKAYSLSTGLSIGRLIGKPLIGRFNYTMDIFDTGVANTFSIRVSKALN